MSTINYQTGGECMKNIEIKEEIKNSRFFNYQIADAIGITEIAFCRWFRKELSNEQIARIMQAIEKLKGECGK